MSVNQQASFCFPCASFCFPCTKSSTEKRPSVSIVLEDLTQSAKR